MNNPFKMRTSCTQQVLTFTAATLLALTLTGCGSGGSSDPSLPTTTPPGATTPPDSTTPGTNPTNPSSPANASTVALQGIWQSPVGSSSSISAVVLPNGALWSVVTSAGVTRLIKADLKAQTSGFSGSAKSYTLGSSDTKVASATATASVVEKSSLSGTLTVVGEQPEAFALAYQSRYDVPAVLTDFSGSWQATLGPGVVNWTIGSTGSLTGTRTTGCTYTGQLSLRTEQKAIVDAVVTENCAGTIIVFNGLAVRSAENARISMVLLTTDESAGIAVNLLR